MCLCVCVWWIIIAKELKLQQFPGNRKVDRRKREGGDRELKNEREGRKRVPGIDAAPSHVTGKHSCPGRRFNALKKGQQIPCNQNRGAWECSWAQALLTEGGIEQTADTMEYPSAPAHKENIPWQRFLLAGKEGTIPGAGQEKERQRLVGVSWGAQCSERG